MVGGEGEFLIFWPWEEGRDDWLSGQEPVRVVLISRVFANLLATCCLNEMPFLVVHLSHLALYIANTHSHAALAKFSSCGRVHRSRSLMFHCCMNLPICCNEHMTLMES